VNDVDKPMRCAEGGWRSPAGCGTPRRNSSPSALGGYDTVAQAVSGGRLRTDEPFLIDFGPADLLP
jgi:hypothetical protein